ncbi:MAG TPA: methyl-accepting chemotaxis protein [Tissierellales bacterium]|nr:methyl-accepting chemotaxis protein [Tissierellales bacterium]
MSRKEKPKRPIKRSHNMNIHKKMVLSVSLTIFIITSLFAVITYFTARKNIQSISNNLQESSGKYIASLAEEKIHNYISGIESISNLNTITNPEVGWKTKVDVLLHEKDRLDYIDFGIADTHGNLTLLNGEVINVSSNEYFQKAIKGETYLSKPFTKLEDNAMELIAISTPLVHLDETVGVLVGFQSSDNFKKNIQNVGLEHNREVRIVSLDENIPDVSPLKYENWAVQIIPEKVSVKNLRGLGLKLFGLALLSLIAGFILAIFMMDWTTKPLIDMLCTMTTIARLDFSKNINRKYLRRSDQIGQIGRACQDTLNNLRNFITKISKSANRVANASNELAFVSNLTAVSTTSFAQSAAGIVDHRKTQIQKILSSIASIKEISSKMEHISKHSIEINELSQDICNKTHFTEKEFEKYMDQIENVASYIMHLEKILTSFNDNSTEMETLAKSMEDIVNQANSVTLNVAIEAAKVDEHGKGLASVTEEFSKLGEQTDVSIEELYNLINKNKELINNAYEVIEYHKNFVANGHAQINNTKNTSYEVINLIDKVSTEIHNMTIAVTYIAEETLDIVNSATSVQDMHVEIVDKAEDVSTVSSEQTISIEEISMASKTLAKSADNLQKLISCVKL